MGVADTISSFENKEKEIMLDVKWDEKAMQRPKKVNVWGQSNGRIETFHCMNAFI